MTDRFLLTVFLVVHRSDGDSNAVLGNSGGEQQAGDEERFVLAVALLKIDRLLRKLPEVEALVVIDVSNFLDDEMPDRFCREIRLASVTGFEVSTMSGCDLLPDLDHVAVVSRQDPAADVPRAVNRLLAIERRNHAFAAQNGILQPPPPAPVIKIARFLTERHSPPFCDSQSPPPAAIISSNRCCISSVVRFSVFVETTH